MTVITGNIRDIGLEPLSGTLIATSVEFRSEGSILIAPESRSWPVTLGDVVVDLLPGPARITVAVGSHVRESWDVVVPESDIDLGTLVADSIEWAPPVVSIVGEHRRAAEAAAQRAEDAADDVDAAISGAADQVVQAVEGDRILAEAARTGAEAARSDAAGHRDTAMGYRDEAQTAQGAAAGSATAAASSASDAAGSASAANSSAGTATAQAGVASTAAGTATTRAGEAAGSASAAAGSATAAASSAEDAELWATSFGLTATSATGAPGTSASVTVTGSGPEYGLAFTVPRGDKGDKGDDGEVSQAALDAAVASLVDNAPEALNTLDELAGALGNDPNFATTVSTEIGLRAKTADVSTALAGKADSGAETTATWAGVSGKPATFPPTIGTTASTAKAGNYQPTWAQVTGKPTTFTPATHTHAKADVGLGNVDNTSDAAKPVSTAQQTALDGKEKKAWQGTQAQYDALGTKDADRTYWIV